MIDGWEIAISVSEPDDGEMAARGVSDIHVQHAFAEIARQLLAAGATLAYGGDFREDGYTQQLIALLNEYAGGPPGRERIRQYLAWPLWETASAEDRARLNRVARPARSRRRSQSPRSRRSIARRRPRRGRCGLNR